MIPYLLVLTDFSAAADHALRYAAAFAERRGAHVLLVHANTHTAWLDPERFTGEHPDQGPAATAAALEARIRELPGFAIAKTGEGSIVEVVKQVAEQYRPEFIVVGRPHTEDLPDEVVSTTALDLLRATPYPLLVVPYNAPLNVPPHRILLAADQQPFTLGPHAGPPHHLLTEPDTRLTVVHVTDEAASSREAAQDGAAALEAVLSAGFGANEQPAPVLRRVTNADAASGILAEIQKLHPSLVVLITRPRSFWGQLFQQSVTAQVIRQSAIPVLLLPATEAQ